MGEPSTHPSARRYPRVPPALLVGAVILLLVGVMVRLLVTGGQEAPAESSGDITYIEGSGSKASREGADLAASIADITNAEVRVQGNGSLFEAEVAAALPDRLRTAALEFRWDISGEDGSAWTLAVTIDKDAQASLFSDAGYGVGTIDDTFLGHLIIQDTTLTVTLEDEIEDFPASFDWNLATTLRAFRDETDSPRVEDRFPDEGFERFEV